MVLHGCLPVQDVKALADSHLGPALLAAESHAEVSDIVSRCDAELIDMAAMPSDESVWTAVRIVIRPNCAPRLAHLPSREALVSPVAHSKHHDSSVHAVV